MTGYVLRQQRVFLLDDHAIVRRGLHDLLDTKADIKVVGDSGSARTAPQRILDLNPHVMLLDVELQDGSGVQVCREVRSVNPDIHGLLLTSYETEQALAATLLAGAEGYVLKLAGAFDIIGAIRRVGEGRSLIDARERDRMTRTLLDRVERARPPLDEEQRRIVPLILDGLTNRQIAERLDAPEETMGPTVTALAERLALPQR